MKTRKIILTLITILLIANIIILPKSYATSADEIIEAGDNFLQAGGDTKNVLNTDNLKNTSRTIYKILLAIAICISVLVGAALGIQFMLGSVEGKVKVQEALVPYIIGCFVVFGAFAIWSMVVNIGNSINSETSPPEVSMKWNNVTDIENYIKNGGDVGLIPDEFLSDVTGKFGRLSERGHYTEEYEKLRQECYDRCFYCKKCNRRLSDKERKNKKCSECGWTANRRWS